MEGLADEEVMLVLSHLPSLADVASFGLVCARFDRLRHDPHLWRTLVHRHLGVNLFRCPPGDVDWEEDYRAKAEQLAEAKGLDRVWVAAAMGCHVSLARLLAEDSEVKAAFAGGGGAQAAYTVSDPFAGSGSGLQLTLADNGLRHACQGGSLEAAKIFLDMGAKLQERNVTPLLNATKWDHVPLIELLLSKGGRVEYPSSNSFYLQPLQVATISLHKPSQVLNTDEHEAASSGCDKAASCLIAHGARLTALDPTHWPSLSHTDQTPLCLAARAGHLSTVTLLFAHCNAERDGEMIRSAALTAVTEGRIAVAKFFFDAVQPFYEQLQALLNATTRPNEELLALFAHLVREAGSSERAYFLFVSECLRDGNSRVCRYLVHNGADINSVRHHETRGSVTALHTAVKEGNVPMAECLLLAGADPDLVRAHDGSMLHSPRSLVQSIQHAPNTQADLAALFARFPPSNAPTQQ